MNTATIEVQHAYPPKPGKKQGTVKTTSDQLYGIWPDKLGLVRPGQTYVIEFTERNFDGRIWRTINKVTPAPEAQEANDNRPAMSPSGPDREFEFVTGCLLAMLQACMVGRTETEITEAAHMLRRAYRSAFTQTKGQ
jgi:hypothetical protein